MKVKSLNGVACCVLNLPCCKPPDSPVQALAKVIGKSVDGWGEGVCREAAEAVLAEYDLVPKGVGEAIGQAYYPIIEHAVKRQKEE